MDIDVRAGRLLRYLASRVTMAVGDNAHRIAAALQMTEVELRQAASLLCALGLASDAPIDAHTRTWAVTDAGLAYVESRRPSPQR